MRRRLPRWREHEKCRYHHKFTYRSFEQCAEACRHAAAREDETIMPHWCGIAGGYHMTSSNPREHSRRQAEGLRNALAAEEQEEDEGA